MSHAAVVPVVGPFPHSRAVPLGTVRRWSMRKDDLTVDEAAVIAEHARSGALDVDDPEVRKVVEQANRVLVRAQMWGEERSPKLRRRRRFIAIGALVMVLVWVAGLLVPLALRFG